MAAGSSRQYDAFLSHNSSDKPAVEELARRLEKDGISCFLDLWHLVPGAPWMPALEEALKFSRSCVVFVGPSGFGPWQNEEMRAAIAQRVADSSGGFRVVPTLLPGAQREQRSRLPAFLAAATWVEFKQSLDDPDAYHRLKCGILGQSPGTAPGEALFQGECPYRGLQVFDAQHARFFFGRDAQVDWMLDRLAKDFGSRQENRFLAVVGASGSGKSSLVRAGLIPALTEGQSRSGKGIPGSPQWPLVIFKPGAEPLKALADALWAQETSKPAIPDPLAYADQARTEPRRLHATIGTALHGSPEQRRYVIVVDQFEELFTQCPADQEQERQAFIDNLLYAATVPGGKTIVLITMRADFYGKCSSYENLSHALVDQQELVPPLGEQDLRIAIERPAYLCGLELEPGLTDLLLQDMRDQPAGALPLLQQALLMLWERRNGRRLTVQAYKDIGEIEGALKAHANALYEQQLKSTEEREACRRVLLMLTTPGEGTEDTRKRVNRQQLGSGGVVESVLQTLAKGRLITFSETQPVQVEVAHEALIRGWDKLRSWLEADRESHRLLNALSDDAQAWEGHRRDPAYLYTGTRLAQAEEWSQKHAVELADLPLAQAFLRASTKQRVDEGARKQAEEQQRIELLQNLAETEREKAVAAARLAETERARAEATALVLRKQEAGKAMLIGFSGVAIVLLLIAAVSGFFTWRTNQTLEITVADLTRTTGDLKTERTNLRTTNDQLQTQTTLAKTAAADANRKLSSVEFILGAVARDRDSDFIEAGHRFLRAAAAADQANDNELTTSMLLAARPMCQAINQSYVHDGAVYGVCFSNDQSKFLTWSEDRTARLWDVSKGEPLRTFTHQGHVRGAAWSKDETRLLTWSADRTARLWDVSKGEPLRTFTHQRYVLGASWSKDETRLLTWSGDHTARLWDVSKDEPLRTFSHQDSVLGAAWSKDETRLLTWSGDHTARLWDVSQDEPLRTFSHQDWVRGAAWSKDETRLLTWSADRTARLWDVSQDEPLRTFSHQGSVRGAAWSKDETRLLTWSDDNTARLWDVSQDEPLRTFSHQGYVEGAAWSKDETRLLTWSFDCTARLWDVSKGEPLRTFTHSGSVWGAAWSEDETHLLTWSADNNTARLWDVSQDEPLRTFTHQGFVLGAAWSKDETRLLTWSDDNTAWLWDVSQGEPLRTFSHSGSVWGAAWSEDETHLLTWSADNNTARLWDVSQDEPLRTFTHQGFVLGAAWSKDETRLLTWSDDHTAWLWDVSQDEPLRTFTHQGPVLGAAWSNDDTRLLTWSDDHTARLWDVSKDELLRTFTHQNFVLGAAWSNDDTRLLTWSGDNTARLWDVSQDEPLRTFTHQDFVQGAAWSKDETRLLTWSDDRTARLWDVSQDEPLRTFTHQDWVRGAAWSKDETCLLTWSEDHTARLWDVSKGELLRMFTHSGSVWGAAWSKDETRLLTWSADRTARLWDVSQDEPLRTFTHQGFVRNAAWSKDETRLLTWSNDRTARLWDVSQDKPLRTFTHQGVVLGAAWSKDETRLLTWSDDRTARLWDIATDNSVSVKQQITDFEKRSGTRVDASGRLRVLSVKEREQRRNLVQTSQEAAVGDRPSSQTSPE